MQFSLKFMCIWHVCICHVCIGAHRDQKWALNPLELRFQAVVSRPTWVLRTKLKSCGRAASILTIEPSLQSLVFLATWECFPYWIATNLKMAQWFKVSIFVLPYNSHLEFRRHLRLFLYKWFSKLHCALDLKKKNKPQFLRPTSKLSQSVPGLGALQAWLCWLLQPYWPVTMW